MPVLDRGGLPVKRTLPVLVLRLAVAAGECSQPGGAYGEWHCREWEGEYREQTESVSHIHGVATATR